MSLSDIDDNNYEDPSSDSENEDSTSSDSEREDSEPLLPPASREEQLEAQKAIAKAHILNIRAGEMIEGMLIDGLAAYAVHQRFGEGNGPITRDITVNDCRSTVYELAQSIYMGWYLKAPLNLKIGPKPDPFGSPQILGYEFMLPKVRMLHLEQQPNKPMSEDDFLRLLREVRDREMTKWIVNASEQDRPYDYGSEEDGRARLIIAYLCTHKETKEGLFKGFLYRQRSLQDSTQEEIKRAFEANGYLYRFLLSQHMGDPSVKDALRRFTTRIALGPPEGRECHIVTPQKFQQALEYIEQHGMAPKAIAASGDSFDSLVAEAWANMFPVSDQLRQDDLQSVTTPVDQVADAVTAYAEDGDEEASENQGWRELFGDLFCPYSKAVLD